MIRWPSRAGVVRCDGWGAPMRSSRDSRPATRAAAPGSFSAWHTAPTTGEISRPSSLWQRKRSRATTRTGDERAWLRPSTWAGWRRSAPGDGPMRRSGSVAWSGCARRSATSAAPLALSVTWRLPARASAGSTRPRRRSNEPAVCWWRRGWTRPPPRRSRGSPRSAPREGTTPARSKPIGVRCRCSSDRATGTASQTRS